VRTKLFAGLFAALAVAASACGSPSADDVLAETAENLGEIESGMLVLRLVVSSEGEDVGFTLDGPFALAKSEDDLPVAEVEYTQIAGAEAASVLFISTGEKAFVRVGEETYELPPEQVDELRGASGSLDGGGGLEELRIGDWFEEPKLSEDGEVGGAETDRVRASLDVVAAANDLIELARAFGGTDVSKLEGSSARQLERAVEKATIEVFTGADDRLLRRLVIDADLEADVPPELEDVLGRLPGAAFHLELTISNVNEPVRVEEPADAQPFPGE